MKTYDRNRIESKSIFLRKETLLLHRRAPATRIASALSTIEIFSTLCYGGFYDFNKKQHRLLISKAHGCFSLYPILYDFGVVTYRDLEEIGKTDALLGSIPDCNAPKIINNGGALGNGLGVACGMAKAFKLNGVKDVIYVIMGDGEFNEGAVWEALAFAAFHKLDNIVVLVDENKKSMLGPQGDISITSPLKEKLEVFGWETFEIDGHKEEEIFNALITCTTDFSQRPKVIIANTVKGKGVPKLEGHPLCHILTLTDQEIETVISGLEVE